MPLYSPFLTKLGAKPIIIPPTEVYTALQRGVVDGFLFSEDAEIPDWGWEEVTKYKILPGFFQIENATLVNLDKWNTLPKELQDALETSIEIFEGTDSVRYLKLKEAGWKKMQKAGMTEIVLPPDDAAELVKTAYEATWETVLKDAPEWGPKLKELLDKPVKK
jgi:TRAP-type C4-dicarboxylate transport system substrate-binding protein